MKAGYGFIISLLHVSSVLSYDSQIKVGFGILKTKIHDSNEFYKHCFEYFPEFTSIPVEENETSYREAVNGYNWTLCSDQPIPPIDDKIVLARANENCSLLDRVLTVENLGGFGSLFVGNKLKIDFNDTNNITTVNMGLISNSTYHDIIAKKSFIIGAYSSVEEGEFFMYYTFIVIWILAQFSIMVGAFWSGRVRHHLYEKEQDRLQETVDGAPISAHILPMEESSLKLSPKVIVLLVILMCIFLVGLWVLLDYLVYLIIGLFCIASVGAVYTCFEPLVMKIPCGTCRTPYFNLYVIQGVLQLRQIILLIICIALPIVWVIFRKHSYAWVLQDFLGIAFCINMMVLIRLPNLMICTLLLCLLVVYDIFFVFVTPFFTSSRTSIMVDVAQGGNGEELPMVLKVPYFVYPEVYDVCNIRDYSLLGFGDIIVPGLLISFVHSFDLKVGTPCRLYYFVNITMYGIGLILTFVCLYLMQGAQPALFYLVPAILLPTIIIAAARGELAPMWNDTFVRHKSNTDETEEDVPPHVSSGGISETGPILSQSPLSSSEGLLNSSGTGGPMSHDQEGTGGTASIGSESPSLQDQNNLCSSSSTEALNKRAKEGFATS